jgi:hypothetical protein
MEDFALSGCCAAFAGKWLPTFRDNTILSSTFTVSLRVDFTYCIWVLDHVVLALLRCFALHFLFRNAFSFCVVSRYFSMSHRCFSFATGPFAFASLPFYSAAYFRSALDASRRFSLPETLIQTGTIWNSWLSKTLWVSTAFQLALFAAQITRHLSLWFPGLVSLLGSVEKCKEKYGRFCREKINSIKIFTTQR